VVPEPSGAVGHVESACWGSASALPVGDLPRKISAELGRVSLEITGSPGLLVGGSDGAARNRNLQKRPSPARQR